MLKQSFAVLEILLGAIGQRLGASLVTIVGIAGVVGVLVSMLAMAQGFQHTLTATGRPDRAIILSKGAPNESSSNLPHNVAIAIGDSAGIENDPDGKPIVSREMLVQLRLPQRGGTLGVVSVRGIESGAMRLRPEIRMVQGRLFRPGLHELIMGRALQTQFPGLQLGRSVMLQGSPWAIVGSFASAGDAHESEMMEDADSLLSVYHRTGFQSVTVALKSPAALAQLKASLNSNTSLAAEAQREDLYYAARSLVIIRVLTGIGLFVGGIMALGAVFASLNTMYAAVASQASLIATLRAIGFNSFAVSVAVLSEALLLGLAGAGLGALLAALLFNGHALGVLSNQAQIFYVIRITPGLGLTGVFWALAIGMLGGLLPAIRAARLPLAEALRAL
jgi:putative ABC transport system permease protein